MALSNPDAGIPPGRNLINTNDNYKRCEEVYVGSNRFFGDNSFTKMLFRSNTSGPVSIIVPLCLTISFFITILGVMFLFTSVFLISKIYVMNIFMSEMNSLIITLVFLITSIHLLATGGSGIVGFTNKRWLLPVHLILGTSVLSSTIVINHFEGDYEPYVMEETKMRLWSTLAESRFEVDSGWDYLQFHLQCCGVKEYTDWCSYIDERSQIDKSQDFRHSHHRHGHRKPNSHSHRFHSAKEVYLSNDTSVENTKENRLKRRDRSSFGPNFNMIQEPSFIIRCNYPNSCCAVNLTLQNVLSFTTAENRECSLTIDNDVNYRGCHSPILSVMKRFVNSFKSLIKFIVVLMMIELPLATFMVFHKPFATS